MVGIGRGAQSGVLIKNAEALERLEKVDTLVLDKTGTLTEGKPKVVALRPAPGFSEEMLLTLAASLERMSEHPLAAAIVGAAADRGLALAKVEGFESVAGKGVAATVDGRKVVLGNGTMMQAAHVDVSALERAVDELRREGATVIFAAIDGKAAGVIAIADPIKATTPDAVRALRRAGVRVVMLTGDNRATAEAVARKLGIDEVEAEVLPQDKGKVVERLRKEGRVVAMAGDGVNDAPALAAADVGIAMGDGNRRRHRIRERHAAQRRPSRRRRRAPSVAGDDAQHPAEPAVRLHLQRCWRADRGGRALSGLRPRVVAGGRRRGDGAVFGQRGRQRASIAERPAPVAKQGGLQWITTSTGYCQSHLTRP